MQNSVRFPRRRLAMAASLVLFLAAAAHGDEIYKWVDKDGKTHYSSRKEDADGATATRMPPAPSAPVNAGAPPAARAANEDVIRRNSPSDAYETKPLQRPATPKPAAGNYASEAGSAKCQLARDILAGNARHRNGAAVDAYDRQVAENDVRTYCGK